MSGSFLWVDSSETGRDVATSKLKHSFIKKRQSESRKAKMQQNLKDSMIPLPAKKQPLQKHAPYPTPSPETEENNGPDSLARLDSPEIKGCRNPPHAAPSMSPTLYKCPEMGPMECLPISGARLKRDINSYFHYHLKHITPIIFPLSRGAMTHWTWQQALDQPSLAAIMLSLSASHRAARMAKFGTPQMFGEAMRDSLELRSQTIKSLQKMTNDPLNRFKETTVLVVAHILCLEATEVNLEAIEGHSQGLLGLVQGSGGLDALANETITQIYCGDIWHALMTDKPLMFSMCPKWRQRIPALPPKSKQNAVSNTGRRLFQIIQSESLHPYLTSFLETLKYLIICYENMLSSSAKFAPIENDRLLLTTYELIKLKESSSDPLEITVILSILLYCISRIWTFQGVPCIAVMSVRLQTMLEQNFAELERRAPDILVWSLFVGALAGHGLPPGDWFVTQMSIRTSKSGLEDWESVKRLLESFLFVYRATDEPANEIWRSIDERRASNTRRGSKVMHVR